MNSATLFKDKMTFDEMAEAYKAEHPFFAPNRRTVGTFAKEHGYILMKQAINNINHSFYLKQQ